MARYCESNEVVFHFAESRGLQVIKDLLGKEFKGTLLTDGYKPYESFAKGNSDVIHAKSWVHTPR